MKLDRLIGILTTLLQIETYGLDCYTETAEGVQFEMGFTDREYLLSWLLGFGNKVKVLEPSDVIEDLKASAENILKNYF